MINENGAFDTLNDNFSFFFFFLPSQIVIKCKLICIYEKKAVPLQTKLNYGRWNDNYILIVYQKN